METRIREFRKLRGMTLKELADKIKTTPQTVQRLETANMTVSMDWLEKIARALLVEPADLVSSKLSREIPLIGSIGKQGRVGSNSNGNGIGDRKTFILDVPASHPLAVRLDASTGPYPEGATLIASRLRDEDIEDALGHNCLVAVKGGDSSILLRRLIRGRHQTWTLVPLDENGGPTHYDQEIIWAARIIMTIVYS